MLNPHVSQFHTCSWNDLILVAICRLYFLAAKNHFYSFAFLTNRQNPTMHISALSEVYDAATSLIQATLDIDLHNSLLQYCPNELMKAFIAASCTLIKILNSSYAVRFDDAVQGRSLFNALVLTIRSISLKSNDFPQRAAEALARMWRAAGSGLLRNGSTLGQDDPLELRICSRMSVSHVYNCFWGWRRTMNIPRPSLPVESPVIPNTQQTYTTLSPPQLEFPLIETYGTFLLEDFDLFNSLDWTLDENASVFYDRVE
jgi:hypothetical protein